MGTQNDQDQSASQPDPSATLRRMRIDELALSAGVAKHLDAVGMTNVGQLTNSVPREILAIEGIGGIDGQAQ
jgi:hypothetical protein